jgi:glycosyltransferase involved in cell wall biosynthesis
MKILFIATALSRGGLERSLAELLDELRDRGIEFTVVCTYRCPGGVQDEVLPKGHDVRFVPDPRLDRHVRYLRRLIRQEQPDLVHAAHTSSLAGHLAALGTGVPVLNSLVAQPYHPDVGRPPGVGPLRHRARRLLTSRMYRHLATHLHAVSEAVKSYAVETLRVPAERITVVRRGRSPVRLGEPSAGRRAAARRMLGLREDDEVVLNVGSHESSKGQRYLLEAAAGLAADRPRLKLLIAGREGPTTSGLFTLSSRLGLEEVVRFLGFRLDVPEVLVAADLFVCSSINEGLPGAVIEASALGLPIVASDIAAIREVVEPNRSALLVPPRNSGQLASAISNLLSDRDTREAFGRRGREIYLERFTLDPVADEMVGLFRRVAAGRAQVSPGANGTLTGETMGLAERQE